MVSVSAAIPGLLPQIQPLRGVQAIKANPLSGNEGDDLSTQSIQLPGSAKGNSGAQAPLFEGPVGVGVDLLSEQTSLSVILSAQGVGAPGNSGNTPAAQARAAIAENPELGEQPFGQIVSQLAQDPEAFAQEVEAPVLFEEGEGFGATFAQLIKDGLNAIAEAPPVEEAPAPVVEEITPVVDTPSLIDQIAAQSIISELIA